MKRSFKLFGSLLLILSLCAFVISASAQADADTLRITKIEISEEGGTKLQTTLTNTGTDAIDEFALALVFLNADGEQIYGYDTTLEGYNAEVCNWYYTPEDPIAAGGTFLTTDVFTAYEGTAAVAVAIRYYHVVDGDYVLIPESNWFWALPGFETDGYQEGRMFYTAPSAELYSSIEGFNLGYQYYLLDDYNAAYYGKNQGGEWIHTVDADSPAAAAGLQVGDLVLFAGGMKPTENLYAVEYAMADIMNGERVDWVYERDGKVYVTQVSKP